MSKKAAEYISAAFSLRLLADSEKYWRIARNTGG
ncbi:hypothetical protein F4694_005047 [Bacillus niacini]|uniref:Uncharacterized protein n=1 Tax=Neobacillus niacini TaxID=86668 RepID=A0A852TMF1_9BACI|nr:hypothetical protein [Neobacillus niacini]